MRVMVTFEHRFMKAPNGKIYTRAATTYDFLCRYLKVFDEMVVISRVEDIDYLPDDKLLAEGPGVEFEPLPCYRGPYQFLIRLPEIKKKIALVIRQSDAYILRVPGTVGTLVYKQLLKKSLSYGIEVVADPWDLLSKGSVQSIFRPIFRRIMKQELKSICQRSSASAYVTEFSLQKRYPPNGWSTSYSSIDLTPDTIVSESVIESRKKRLAHKLASIEPVILCCTGQMSQLYKAQDILITAFAKCLKNGLNLHLWLIGDGRFRPTLERLARDLRVSERVVFWGSLPAGQAVYNKLDQADIFVLPSRQEGLPRAMIEAMARGLPCIGSNVGGVGELIDQDNMVPPDSIKLLAQKIRSFVNNPERLSQKSGENLKKSKDYRQIMVDVKRKAFYEKVRNLYG